MFEILEYLWNLLTKAGYLLWFAGVVMATIGYRMHPFKDERSHMEITLVYISGVIAIIIGFLFGNFSWPFLLAALVIFPYGIAALNEALGMRDGKTVLTPEQWQEREDKHQKQAEDNFINFVAPKRDERDEKKKKNQDPDEFF